MNNQYKYFAFISYSSKDTEWGKRLQKKLEHYQMPATLCSERGWKRNPMNPVFFAPTDIQPGGLTEELQERLKASRNLIVICSPNSAKSQWVGKEIQHFLDTGRRDHILPFIVSGTSYSGDENECLNPVLKAAFPEGDILGVNIHDYGDDPRIYRKRKALVKTVSMLIEVPDAYNYLWNASGKAWH